MPGYYWRVTYNGGGLETQGNTDVILTPNLYPFFSPIALTTQGFLYGVGDIWFNLEDTVIQNVVWSPCDCAPQCE